MVQRKSGASNREIGLVRLQKVLADAGVSSRRGAEELITAGRVSVDGKVVRILGTAVDPLKVEVMVDGQPISLQTTKIYLAFNKPRGVLSTMSDPEGRPCLGDFLVEKSERLYHVGRLDKESEGLILLTNDGDWANEIAHPSKGVFKRYRVWTSDRVTPDQIRAMLRGVNLEDGSVRARSASSFLGGFEIEIHEGRNQIVRRVASELGLTVLRLQRVQIGKIALGELPAGKWRNLSAVETIQP